MDKAILGRARLLLVSTRKLGQKFMSITIHNPLGPLCIRVHILDYLLYYSREKGVTIDNAHQTSNNHKEDRIRSKSR
jgi:hypothetical protein